MIAPRGLGAMGLRWTLVSLAAACSGAASAAGLGAGDAGATMGQPLNFGVIVRLDAGETLSAECVAAEVAIGDRRLPSPLVRTLLEPTSPTTVRVRVQTQGVVDEPVVQVQLSVGCSSRITRNYVVLADPPGLLANAPAPGAVAALPAQALAPAAVPPAWAASAPAAGAAEAPPPAVATRPAPVAESLTPEQQRARAERQARQREQRLARQRAAREARAARQQAEAQRAAAAPRLQLDMVEPAPAGGGASVQTEALARAMAAVAEAASAAEAAASAASASALRIAALEQELASLRQEAKASGELSAALREQLLEARSAGRWTTPLALASLLLAALAAWLAWRLGRAQAAQRAQWQQASGIASSGPVTEVTGLGGLGAPNTRDPTVPASFVTRDGAREGRSTVILGPEPAAGAAVPPTVALPKPAAAAARANRAWPPPAPPVAWPPPPSTLSPELPDETVPGLGPDAKTVPDPRRRPVFTPEHDLAPDAPMQRTETLPAGGRGPETSPRDVSIEELIDLEQQAEFFMVLGQDEAAIDLLVEHLRSTGGGSPLPYLKLLEIHHRRGDREAYERMRQRFNHRFNAYAPEWGVDLTSGRTLEDYVGVIPRLQQVWSRPLDAMAELEALLFRKSRGELFDLPAYREVLFLYALARDLLDRAAADTGSVDLLLPMSDGTEDGSTAPAPFLGLEHDAFKDTMPPEDPRPTAPLDFDLTGGDRPTSIFDLLDDKPRPPRQP
jgi:hypothetical protein